MINQNLTMTLFSYYKENPFIVAYNERYNIPLFIEKIFKTGTIKYNHGPETCLVRGQNAGQNCMGAQNVGWFWGGMKILNMFAS